MQQFEDVLLKRLIDENKYTYGQTFFINQVWLPLKLVLKSVKCYGVTFIIDDSTKWTVYSYDDTGAKF